MADRYWIGNAGTWSDTAHWSASSGGSGGETVPTLTDNVIIDEQSFSVPSQVIELDNIFSCLDFTGASSFQPQIAGAAMTLQVYGDFLTDGLVGIQIQTINFMGTSGAATITTNGTKLAFEVKFSPVVGSTKTWTLGSNFSQEDGVHVGSFGSGGSQGNFSMGGFSMVTNSFTLLEGTNTLDGRLTTSNFTYDTNFFPAVLTASGGTVVIAKTTGSLVGVVNADLLTFNVLDINVNSTLTNWFSAAIVNVLPGIALGMVKGNFDEGAQGFDFTAWNMQGTAARPIRIFSTTLGSPVFVESDSVSFQHLVVKDQYAGGLASPFDAGVGSVSRGNNTNWLFPDPALREENVFMVAASTDGTVQTINIGQSDDGESIFYEIETQEIEFGNRAHLKKIANQIAIFTRFGDTSSLTAKTDTSDYKPVAESLNKRVNIAENMNLEGHFVVFRWFGTAEGVTPIFEGLYLENISDMGMTYG